MLSQQEINKRLTKLRNYESLYPRLKKSYEEVRAENKLLKARIVELEGITHMQSAVIDKLQLQVEELRIMVFGRKKKDKDSDGHNTTGLNNTSHKQRSSSSFRRPTPNESDITITTPHSITHCPDCNTELTRIKDIIRYVEDMILPNDLINIFKQVEKLIITSGYCVVCRKRVSVIPIQKQTVSLGPNVCKFIAYASTILRLTYDQTRSFLKDMVHLSISDGEISHILAEQALVLRPEQERLKQLIRGQTGQHYDETSWKVRNGIQGNYAWVMTGTESPDAVFLIGRSRGKGNAKELQGSGIGITDDYGAYRRMFTVHQLCWAHPHRKLRDLAQSETLDDLIHDHCCMIYDQFASLYCELRAILAQPFDLSERQKLYSSFHERLLLIAQSHPSDPAKLVSIKEGLRRNIDSYLTCLLYPDIPADNNKAERALRHLVLKRKNSYGSKTQAGADTASILTSTLLSAWWRRPDNFFVEYDRMVKGR